MSSLKIFLLPISLFQLAFFLVACTSSIAARATKSPDSPAPTATNTQTPSHTSTLDPSQITFHTLQTQTAAANTTQAAIQTQSAQRTATATSQMAITIVTYTSTSTPSSTPTLTWEELPQLKEVIVTEKDVVSAGTANPVSAFAEPGFTWRDVTSELEGRCLLDCAKVVLTNDYGYRLTIILLRASSLGQAEQNLLSPRTNFLDVSEGDFAEEYSMEALYSSGIYWAIDASPNLPPSNSWLVERIVENASTDSFEFDLALGTSRGPVIGLFILEFEFCKGNTEYCIGDIEVSPLIDIIVAFAEFQMEKLAQLGYTP